MQPGEGEWVVSGDSELGWAVGQFRAGSVQWADNGFASALGAVRRAAELGAGRLWLWADDGSFRLTSEAEHRAL
jgi:hypothetical protein